MICWKHLLALVPFEDEPASAPACPECGAFAYDLSNIEIRSDRFFALVAAETGVADCGTSAKEILERACNTMSEIERRVEAGSLFQNGGS